MEDLEHGGTPDCQERCPVRVQGIDGGYRAATKISLHKRRGASYQACLMNDPAETCPACRYIRRERHKRAPCAFMESNLAAALTGTNTSL
jgi:hypothetical protein